MLSGKEQYQFFSEEKKLTVPETLSPEIFNLVNQRKLWQQRPKGNMSLYRSSENEFSPQSFTATNGQFFPDSFLNVSSRKNVGLIVQINDLTEATQEKVKKIFEESAKVLRYGSPIFVIEIKTESALKSKDREFILRSAGFVKANVLTSISEEFTFWEAKMQAPKRKRKPLDLTDPNSPKYWYRRTLWREMTQTYKKQGFELVAAKDSKILKALKASTYPAWTISALKSGFGVTVRSVSCGICTWEIDMRGSETKKNDCGTGDCAVPHVHRNKENSLDKNPLIGEKILERKCGCGEHLVQARGLIEDLGGGRFKVLEEIKCPHHGLIEGWGKEKIVSR